jgi:acyl dehydratase
VYDARVSAEVGAHAWIRTRNLAADAAGSIHDDAEARRRGLPGGLVPGNVQLALVQRAAVDALGPDWYARGSLRFLWRRPLYEGDEVRVRVTETDLREGEARALAIALEKRDGAPAATARVALAESAGRLRPPWDDEPDPARTDPARDPLPEEPLGFRHAPRRIALEPAEIERALADLDPSPWYRETSPFGAPILPVVAFLPFTGQGRRRRRAPEGGTRAERPRTRIRAGMNGALDLVMTGPLFVGERYDRQMVTVDKGFARRTAYRTLEIALAHVCGQRRWHARWRANWFPSEDGAQA